MKGLSAGALTDCTDALTDEGRRRVATSKTRRGEAVCSGQAATVARRCSSRLVSQTQMPAGMSKSMEMSFWLTFFGRSLSHLPPSYPSLPPSLPPDSCFTSTGSK
jgi:hypothetical protein